MIGLAVLELSLSLLHSLLGLESSGLTIKSQLPSIRSN